LELGLEARPDKAPLWRRDWTVVTLDGVNNLVFLLNHFSLGEVQNVQIVKENGTTRKTSLPWAAE